jgi:hypothetical protein
MSFRNFRLTVTLLSIAILAMAAQIAVGQETRGTIRGVVTDPNGQAVPNATVQVLDPARGSRRSFTTNNEGLYQATYLTPGFYQIVVEAPGFKKSIRDNVELQIGAAIQADIKLEVGGASETVTVTSDIPPLNTENASLGQVVDARRLEDLPLPQGDPYKLIGLSAGVAYTGSARLDRPFEPTHIIGYAIDGTRGNRSDLTIDGAPSTATANANEVIATYVPPSDIVQEFKVQTATFDSQFGNTEGGVTSISIKSGKNTLNGSAYYHAQPGTWAANDFFGNGRGTPRPKTESNRYGGYLSGPVRIPWLYNGKDKTFFLFGYEGIRDARPRFDAAAGSWVPTTAIANGDFSAYLPTGGCPGSASAVCIYDPLTRVATGNTFTGTAFAGNIIPANRIDPVARAVLTYFAKAKQPGLVGNIFDSSLNEQTKPYNNYTFRVDQNIGNNNHLFVRGSYYDRVSVYNDYTGTEYSGVNFIFKARQGVIDDVHTFNSTTFLNVRYGYNRFIRAQDQEPDAQNFDLTKLWGSTAGAAYNSLVGEGIRRFPRFDFSNGPLGNGMGNEFRPVDTHSYSIILTKLFNRHSMKFGGEQRTYIENSSFASNDQTGQFIFDNTYTRPSTAAFTDSVGLQGMAAFLLGLPSTQQIVRAADYSEYSKTYGLFFQDDWKVNDRLTLNLGVRWEIETPMVEKQNKSVSGFDPDYVQPSQAAARARLVTNPVTGYTGTNIDPATFNVRGGLLFAGKDTGNGLYETPKDVILPRFGVTFKLNDKTVLRGGFGLFAGFLGERRGDVIQPGYRQVTTRPLTQLASGAPIPFSMSTFPTSISIIEPVGNARGRQTSLGTGISFFNQNPEVSKQARFQFGIQRDLGMGWAMEASYVGNYGYDIEISRNINALPNQYLSTLNVRTTSATDPMTLNNTLLGQTVANPFVGLADYAGTGFINATIARSQLLRPFPNFGDITTSVNDGKSWYHSAQLNINKRFSQGYTIGAAYTWSKWLQATEYLNAGDALPTKMISDQDTPHRLSLSGIYELPFGKNKMFLSGANGVVDRIVNGWQVQAVFQYQAGFPIPFGTNLFYVGGEIALPKDQRTTDRWFNTAAFVNVRDGGNGTTAAPVSHLRTVPLRFANVRRDNINDVSLSFLKNTAINEKVRLQFRLEFSNAFNEAYFPNPAVNPTQTSFGTIAPSNQDNYARRTQIGIKLLF